MSIISLTHSEPCCKWKAGKKKGEEKKKEKGGSILGAENASHVSLPARLSVFTDIFQSVYLFGPEVMTLKKEAEVLDTPKKNPLTKWSKDAIRNGEFGHEPIGMAKTRNTIEYNINCEFL
ncbi:hypothetical protein H671_8g19373 [Cricetulus griseus]|nr:hypothetical protein H671_8g19373 [Cricetulus griseus]